MRKFSEWWRWRHVPKQLRKVFDYAIAESYPYLVLGVYKKRKQIDGGCFLGYTPNHVMLKTDNGIKYVPFKRLDTRRLMIEYHLGEIEKWADSPAQARYHTTQTMVEQAIHDPHYQVFGVGMQPNLDSNEPVLSHVPNTWFNPEQLAKDSPYYVKPVHRRSSWYLVHRTKADRRLHAFFADQIVIHPRRQGA